MVAILDNEVHLWFVDFKKHQKSIEHYLSLLDADEVLRAKRFRFEKDYKSYVISHAALRLILSRHLKMKAEKIEFSYGEHQKPYLKDHLCWHFNLSHSGDYALIALNRHDDIGVDIERMRELSDFESLVERFFSKEEIAQFLGLSANQRIQSFYQAWTSKEAYVKAIGKGLSLMLSHFDVRVDAQKAFELLAIEEDSQKAKDWQLKGGFFDEYAWAVALKSQKKKITTHQF